MTTTTEQIILNVGGTSFTTTKSTLLRHPDSALAALVRFNQDVTSDKTESTPVTPIPTVFLDEDPEVFKLILTYLRHDILAMSPKGEPSLAAVKAVGEYLNLPGLVQKARDVAGPTGPTLYKAVCSYGLSRSKFSCEFPLASLDAVERIRSLDNVDDMERVSMLVGKAASSGVDWYLRDLSILDLQYGVFSGTATWLLMEGRKRSA
ncbi:hypothetical protein HK104_002076 [Borealophlyctis nickersoniae]|nr:hypothetical protein HK104_002076 [Borealophlyctis nickersoniae]